MVGNRNDLTGGDRLIANALSQELRHPPYLTGSEGNHKMKRTFTKTAYGEKLKDPRWQKLRLEIFNRDGFACRVCGAKHKPLNAHHSYYERDVEGIWDYDPRSIITLCEDCHSQEHEFSPQAREALIQQACIMGFATAEKLVQLNDILTAMWLGKNHEETRETFMSMVTTYWNDKSN